MKTPRFWYARNSDTIGPLPLILSPFSLVFKAGTFLRRKMATPYRPSVPLICVGNIVAGGAGKTPTCLSLAKLLRERGHRPVFVTRGYGGRITSGTVVCVDRTKHSARDVGDEALLLAATAPTWAGKNRVEAIRQAESHGTIIIMDDGLQNPNVLPSLAILIMDGEVGIGNGFIMPAGPLRESFDDALLRVGAMIIIGEKDSQSLAARTKLPTFRARLQPDLPMGFPRVSKFVAFAGIGRPEKFYATARMAGLDIVETCDFPDHHFYSEDDRDALRLRAEEKGARLLTTEKDAVRLPADFAAEVITLPVKLVFDKTGSENELVRLCGALVG
jgi:tetraacyldisaccharide 4'-kinase